MARHLVLRLEAPMMAFGTTLIDSYGPVQDFPAASLLTGLMANALGWDRSEAARHQQLQDRLVYAVRLEREGQRLRDYQTADLEIADVGWTTRGKPEGRAGGAGTYKGQHQRQRWYQADACALVALRLDPNWDEPTLEQIAEALERPARPLFIGRKPCLPAGPIVYGWANAATTALALSSLDALADGDGLAARTRMFWPQGEGPVTPDRREVTGCRNWRSDVHAGRECWFGGQLRDVAP